MKRELCDYLICPGCGGDLDLDVFEEKDDGIEEGLLQCRGCRGSYPVLKSIPRMLPPGQLESLVTGYRDFVDRHGVETAAGRDLTVHDTDETIARGFEFEWKKHPRILSEHELEFRHVLGEVLPVEEIRGKVVLDAGCGQGRFSHFFHTFGASTVIAFDLGEQTLIADRNNKAMGNDHVHVVQASIYDPPFRKAFDIISSIGVIHHLPEPEKGFRTLYELLREEGRIFIWVYGYSSIIPIIRFLRLFSLGLGVKMNRFLGFFFAVPLYLLNQLYNLLRALGLKGAAALIPWHMYHDRGFSNIWTICFDKLNSAIAVYYRREDLQGWLDRLPEKKEGVLSERYPGKSGSSWRLMARK